MPLVLPRLEAVVAVIAAQISRPVNLARLVQLDDGSALDSEVQTRRGEPSHVRMPTAPETYRAVTSGSERERSDGGMSTSGCTLDLRRGGRYHWADAKEDALTGMNFGTTRIM